MPITTAPVRRTRNTPAARETVRTPNHERGVAIGRDGNPIRRVRSNADRYNVDGLAPAGWVYQWNAVSVLGDPNLCDQAALQRAGWTPVPAERHDGVLLPSGSKGEVVIGGLRLDERPIELEMEAREEETFAAQNEVYRSKQQFGFAAKAPGFEGADRSNNPKVRANTFARSEVISVGESTRTDEMAID